MKSIHIFSTFVIIAWSVFSGCGADSKPSSAPPSPDAAPPASPKPEVILYAVTVNKLNLREEPNKNAKVVVQFAEGDFVEGTGEVSANKEEVTLRDIPYNEPYYKIKSTAPAQQLGWAYGAALKPVYAGSKATSPDLQRLMQLSAFFTALNTTKIDSGKKAVDYVKTNLAGASGTLADAAFILLESFLSRMEMEGNFYNLTEVMQWTDEDYEAIHAEKFDMNKYPLTKSLAANGFRLELGEGMVFPIVDWAQLANFFASKVTPPMKQYILQNVAEQKESAYDDGGIIIGLDTLAERAIFWEKFNQQNPYFVRNYQTQESERWLRLVMVNGSDNSPVFNYENQTVSEEFKKVWALILQKYPGSKLARAVKQIADLVAAEGGKRTKKVEDWQTKFANEYSAQ